MNNIIKIIIDYGPLGIAIAAFSEAIFMPLPMEVISLPIYLVNSSRAIIYSLTLIFFSALGSLAGYFIGRHLGKPLLVRLVSAENITKIKKLYDKNSFVTVLTSSFTPIPYEAYVLSAGAFDIGISKFLLASLISRVIRHLPQGIIIAIYGDTFVYHIKNYTILIGIIIFIIVLLLKFSYQLKSKQ